jgi:hypothetical protein
MRGGIRLSVAIPVHNEESILPELLRRIRKVLGALPGSHASGSFNYESGQIAED